MAEEEPNKTQDEQSAQISLNEPVFNPPPPPPSLFSAIKKDI